MPGDRRKPKLKPEAKADEPRRQFPVWITRELPTFNDLRARVMRLRNTPDTTSDAACDALRCIGIDAAKRYQHLERGGVRGFTIPLRPHLTDKPFTDTGLWFMSWEAIVSIYSDPMTRIRSDSVVTDVSEKQGTYTLCYSPDRWRERCEVYAEVLKQLHRLENGATRSDTGSRPARHSPDFRSVHWFGTDYSFTPTQAAIVKLLWEAWENGTPDVSDAWLLTKVESTGNRLSQLFNGHPAWGTMIGAGKTKGTRRLTPPKN